MNTDERQLWERQSYETTPAFRAFGYYLQALSVDGAYRLYLAERRREGDIKEEKSREKPRKAARAPRSWKNWAQGRTSTGEAQEGALTWEERAQAWESHVWAQRRREWAEEEYKFAKKAMKKARKLLKLRLPEKFNSTGAARLAETASKLARLSTGEPTERHDLTSGGEKLPAGMSPEQVRAAVD